MVGDLDTIRGRDRKRCMQDGFERTSYPDSTKIESITGLLKLLGYNDGNHLPTGTTFELSQVWCDLMRPGPLKYDQETTKLPGSTELLAGTLATIESGLGRKSRRNKNLHTYLKNMLDHAGIKLDKQDRGKQRSRTSFTLRNRASVEYLTGRYHLYHSGAEALVSVADWESCGDALQEYLANVQREVEDYAIQSDIYNDDLTNLAEIDNGDVYEELICEEGLKQLVKDNVESERSGLQAILAELVPSFKEPDKRCLRRVYHKKGDWGREWAKYPAMAYAGCRVRASLCRPLYWDLDMVKCHAMICLNIAERYGLELGALREYVANPDKVLREISTYYLGASPQACKQLVNSILNRGTVGGWVAGQEQKYFQKGTGMAPKEAKSKIGYGGVVDKAVLDMMTDFKMGRAIMDKVRANGNHPIVQEFDDNIKQLHAFMKREFKDVFDDALSTIENSDIFRKKYPTLEHRERKAFSDCLFEVENRLLNAMIRSLRSQGFRVDAKIHDGCHVRKVEGMDTIPDDVVAKVVADVKRDTNFDIQLKVKEMVPGPKPLIKKPTKAAVEYEQRTLAEHARDTSVPKDVSGFPAGMLLYNAASQSVLLAKETTRKFAYKGDVGWEQDESWTMAWGKRKEGEDYWTTAVREYGEEVGSAPVTHFRQVATKVPCDKGRVFLIEIRDTSTYQKFQPTESKITDVKWWPVKDVLQHEWVRRETRHILKTYMCKIMA
jgi:hypothetical protein